MTKQGLLAAFGVLPPRRTQMLLTNPAAYRYEIKILL
jgi:hypothetical protein